MNRDMELGDFPSERTSLLSAGSLRGEQKRLEALTALQRALKKEIWWQESCWGQLGFRHKFAALYVVSLIAAGHIIFFFLKSENQLSNEYLYDWNQALMPGSTMTCAQTYNDVVKCHILSMGDEHIVKTSGFPPGDASVCVTLLYKLCGYSCAVSASIFSFESVFSPKECKGGSVAGDVVAGIGLMLIVAVGLISACMLVVGCLHKDNGTRTGLFFYEHGALMKKANVTRIAGESLSNVLRTTEHEIETLTR